MELMPWQKEAVEKLESGKVLYGGVGSGKGIASLAYYVKKQSPKDLIVITTASKRNSLDWQMEALLFCISPDREDSAHGTITVDSWNNVMDYKDRRDCFFIFDEQRVVGSGAWVKSFLKIAKHNDWILLSGTPGDTWLDYAPVFVANGFYKNLGDFKYKHVRYKPFVRYPVVEGYYHEERLQFLRNNVLVEMPMPRDTVRHLNWFAVDHNEDQMLRVTKDRWNIFEDQPVTDISEMWRLMRRVSNTDPSRLETVRELMKMHPRLIVFYNFDYELNILRSLEDEVEVFEYNGHFHDPVPDGERWVYLVQYLAGAEAWNCITTNAMVMYSLTYSWKNFEQCQGRIDRMTTRYVDLYYYILVSNTVVDNAIKRALANKKDFNERREARKVAAELGFKPEPRGGAKGDS